MIGNSHPVDPRARLAWEVRTVAERFRHLSEARLAARFGPYESRAEAGRHVAQRLADAAAGVAARAAPAPPQSREVPAIGMFAVGEQIAVTGRDLVAELAAVADEDLVWYDSQRIAAADLIARIIDALREIRLTL